jgi:hypothetical protein
LKEDLMDTEIFASLTDLLKRRHRRKVLLINRNGDRESLPLLLSVVDQIPSQQQREVPQRAEEDTTSIGIGVVTREAMSEVEEVGIGSRGFEKEHGRGEAGESGDRRESSKIERVAPNQSRSAISCGVIDRNHLEPTLAVVLREGGEGRGGEE